MSILFSVSGVIVQAENHKPVANVRIEAWDRDLIFDDFLGSAISDEEGRFHIHFDPSKFQEIFFDRKPDVFFKVFRVNSILFSTRDSLVVTVDQPTVNISLEIPSSSDDLYSSDVLPVESVDLNKFKSVGKGAPLEPSLEAETQSVKEGSQLIIRGVNWPDCMVTFDFNKKELRMVRVITGFQYGKEIRPAGDGSFLVVFAVGRMGKGELQLIAKSAHARKFSAILSVNILANPHIYPDAEMNGLKLQKSFLRQEDFFKRRFGHLGYIPPNMRTVQLADVRRLRFEKHQQENHKILRSGGSDSPRPSPPMAGVCSWKPLGPACIPHGSTRGFLTVAGRILCITIDETAPTIMFIGTAGGGIWKSTDRGETWSPRTDYHMSMAIGCMAISPRNHLYILAGTGEYHHFTAGTLSYYGNGLLRSMDGGETWSEVSGPPFDRNEISRIVFDPSDTEGNRVFLSCTTGIYQSADGISWALLREGSVSDLAVFDDPYTAGNVVLMGAFYSSGLWTATRSEGVWSSWTKISSAAIPISPFGRIALWQNAANRLQITAMFGTHEGVRIAWTNNGGELWNEIVPRFAPAVTEYFTSSAGSPAHAHLLSIPVEHLTGDPVPHEYTSSSAGTPAHTHTFSFTARDILNFASGASVTVLSNPDESGHQHQFYIWLAAQLDYNFVIAAHPTNPNRYYVGHIALFRTDDAAVFNSVTHGSGPTPTGIHVDQHAFAFDPVNPDIIWAGNDGGLFRSTNAGDHWESRNRDLATLQYMHVSSHPQWENIMIGGTQDNGIHRYSGHPAWKFCFGGDGAFTAIDPLNPMRMYGASMHAFFSRSDDAGVNWVNINHTIQASGDRTEMYPPFVLDPSAPDTCYFGAIRLWRSPDNGNTWTPITALLSANISALAVHPTDSNTVYAGCTNGSVYRVQRTGARWDTTGVTTTEITAASLPAGLYISDIAVEPSGTVWVTFASISGSEWTGEFSNDHVFRRTPGSTGWEGRNNGLAMANPVNTIVIDPADSRRLFIGTDLGIFRTENSGGMWTIWDEGLPNVPVFHLNIFSPLNLLRAGTHGRGVWERPIDSLSCPLVDLYVRDNILDSGRINPSPEYVQHPFDLMLQVYHWQCADVKVDSPEGSPPAMQTSAALNDYIFFEADLNHRSGKRSITNRVYAQVHNRGINKATNVKMRLFFTDAHAGLPSLAANFWMNPMPFSGTPSGTDWVPIGDMQTFPVLEPAEPGVKSWEYTIPASANEHSCLLLVVSCDENVLNGGGTFNVDDLVLQNKQVGVKNLHVVNAPLGAPMEIAPLLGFCSQYQDSRQAEVVIHWGNLPAGTRAYFSFSTIKGRPALSIKGNVMKKLGLKQVDDPKHYFTDKHETRCGASLIFDFGGAIEATTVPGMSLVLPGLQVLPKASVYLQFNLVLPKTAETGDETQFSILQQQGNKIVGGSTYLVRIVKDSGKDLSHPPPFHVGLKCQPDFY